MGVSNYYTAHTNVLLSHCVMPRHTTCVKHFYTLSCTLIQDIYIIAKWNSYYYNESTAGADTSMEVPKLHNIKLYIYNIMMNILH